MAHKTFISYKYSEAQTLRNDIVDKLGRDASYYKGETSTSPDLGDLKTATIKSKLSDMIYDTTVMIVIVSPNMTQSSWMNWEIKYALREQSRNGIKSYPNGIICVVQKDSFSAGLGLDPYSWAKIPDGRWSASRFFNVLVQNMDNKKSWMDSPIPSSNKALYDGLSSNYIDIVTEDEFLRWPTHYIEKTFIKYENQGSYRLA